MVATGTSVDLVRQALDKRRSDYRRQRTLLNRIIGKLGRMLAAAPVAQLQPAGDGYVNCALPEFEGQFKLPADGHLAWRLKSGPFESSVRDLFYQSISAGGDVIDIGANVGFYAVLAAKRCGAGRVLAVEPIPQTAALLRENAQQNGVTVIVVQGVASDQPGETQIETVPGHEEYSSVGGISHPNAPQGNRRTLTVACHTVDQLTQQNGLRPSLMKIDVEGYELPVFRGAQATLREFRPVIFSELDQRLLSQHGASTTEVLAILAGLNYQVFDSETGAELITPEKFVGDIVAVPR